jgi:hypothetical protein
VKPTIICAATEKMTAVINLFNYAELQSKEWTSASMALHQAMINSFGTLNLATIERLSRQWVSSRYRAVNCLRISQLSLAHCTPMTFSTSKITSRKSFNLSLLSATSSVGI